MDDDRRVPYPSPVMADETEPQREARAASEFYTTLLALGLPERVVVECTVAYILGRQRRQDRESEREDWKR